MKNIVITGKVSKKVFAEANAMLFKKKQKKSGWFFLGFGILFLIVFNCLLIVRNHLNSIDYCLFFFAVLFISYPLFIEKWYYKRYYASYYDKDERITGTNILTISDEKTTIKGASYHIDFKTKDFNQLFDYKDYLVLSKGHEMTKALIIEKNNLQKDDLEKLKQFAQLHHLKTNL